MTVPYSPPKITDANLRKCLQKRCKNGKIGCSKAKPKGPGNAGAVLGTNYGSKAVIYLNWFQNGQAAGFTFGDVIIHEWAETCGWKHGDGNGVPDSDISI